MANVQRVSDRYANFLTPVPGRGPGICRVCRTSVTEDWQRCYQCAQAASHLPVSADAVVPMALAVNGEQLARELWAYKNPRAQQLLTFRLAAAFWRWLAAHERCVAAAAGVPRFEVVTSVPSTRGRAGDHPLVHLLGMVGTVRGRHQHLLRRATATGYDVAAWDVTAPVAGRSVLLVDDTWTTGVNAQTAAAALRTAGAAAVGVVVIGRHFRRVQEEPYREAADSFYRTAKALPWDWDVCCLDRDS